MSAANRTAWAARTVATGLPLRLLLLAALLLVGTGCDHSDDDDGVSVRDLRVYLVLRDVFQQEYRDFMQGEEIELVMTVHNPTDETITLEFVSGYQYNFIVTDDADQTIWVWSDCCSFIQAFTSLEFSPGESMVFREVWDQTATDGEPAPIGRYRAHGFLVDGPREAVYDFQIF